MDRSFSDQTFDGSEMNAIRELRAREAMKEMADQGDVEACLSLAQFYDFRVGSGVADERMSFVYYEKAANLGHAESQHNLGCMWRDGRGCEQSHEQAVEWLARFNSDLIAFSTLHETPSTCG